MAPLSVQSRLSGLGRPQQQESDACWSMSYSGPKSGTAISLWERRLPPPGRSPWEVWTLSFSSVDLKVAVWWRKKEKKGNVDERGSWLASPGIPLKERCSWSWKQLVREPWHSGKLGVKLLPLAMTSCLFYSIKCNFRVQQAHDAERLLHGWLCLKVR